MENNILIIVSLVLSVLALLLAGYNTFKINHNKRVRDVNLINQREDIFMSMESIKVSLQKEIRRLQKDVNRFEKDKRGTPNKKNPTVKKIEDKETPIVKKAKRVYNRKKPVQKKIENTNETGK